ncbi:hypothetical protein IWW43_003030 [Coemansia sp. RSA 1935]|nr:hypothetical protein IWW43_003030 [Coemansia sp. RSA 1935]
MASPQKPCHICDKPAAKHQGCTESFYKHQVEEAVQAQRVDEETKQEMQQIVQQYEDQIDQDQMKAAALSQDSDDMSSINSDDEDETSLAERLQGIDLSGDMDANTLSAPYEEHLASAFEDMIKVAPLLASQISDVYSSAIEALKVGFCNIDDAMSNESKCALLDDMLAIYANPAYGV